MSIDIKTSSPFVFNEAVCKLQFSKIEKLVNEHQGKKGYNPFLWLHENVNDLANRFRKGERTEGLQKAILAIPLEIPKLNLTEDNAPTEYNVKRDLPIGLNIPQKEI